MNRDRLTPDAILAATFLALVLLAGLLVVRTSHQPNPASIGGNTVTGLTCTNEEVIAYDQATPAPHALGCIHLDELEQ